MSNDRLCLFTLVPSFHHEEGLFLSSLIRDKPFPVEPTLDSDKLTPNSGMDTGFLTSKTRFILDSNCHSIDIAFLHHSTTSLIGSISRVIMYEQVLYSSFSENTICI